MFVRFVERSCYPHTYVPEKIDNVHTHKDDNKQLLNIPTNRMTYMNIESYGYKSSHPNPMEHQFMKNRQSKHALDSNPFTKPNPKTNPFKYDSWMHPNFYRMIKNDENMFKWNKYPTLLSNTIQTKQYKSWNHPNYSRMIINDEDGFQSMRTSSLS